MKASHAKTIMNAPPLAEEGLSLPRTLALLVLVTLLAPLAGAHDEDARSTQEQVCHYRHTSMEAPCRLASSAVIDVAGCDEAGCTLLASAASVGTAEVPGALGVRSVVSADKGFGMSFCVGPRVVSDQLPLPCLTLCESDDVGFQSACEGDRQAPLALPPGECVFVHVMTLMDHTLVAGTFTAISWHVCRGPGDRLVVTALG